MEDRITCFPDPFIPSGTTSEGEKVHVLSCVEETDMTLGGCPIIRVDGFFYVGESDMRFPDEEPRWASSSKRHFVFKGRSFTRVDQTRAAVEYFGLKPHFCAELKAAYEEENRLLSEGTDDTTKG
ncbi:hypothetical protein [Streptomyces sp. NPDC088752]|uniref:hypothetical protein n=1 Tax=Streptomyces sp. NPDC088752 TaxID=3154963 RepID=UPI003425E3E4